MSKLSEFPHNVCDNDVVYTTEEYCCGRAVIQCFDCLSFQTLRWEQIDQLFELVRDYKKCLVCESNIMLMVS